MVVVFFFVYVSRGKRRRRTPGPSEVLPPPSELQSDARKNPSGLGKTPSESTRCQHVRISLSRERHFFQPLVFFFLFLCISPVMRMIRTMAQEKKQTKKTIRRGPDDRRLETEVTLRRGRGRRRSRVDGENTSSLGRKKEGKKRG